MIAFPSDRAEERGLRLRWLTLARLSVLVLAAVLVLLAHRGVPGLAMVPLALVLSVLIAWNLGLLVYLSRPRGRKLVESTALYTRLLHALVALDIISLTLLIHFSGGAENPFYPLYAFPIIVAAALLGRRSALIYAGIVATLYLVLLIGEWRGVLPHHPLLPADFAVYRVGAYVVAQAVGLGLVCILAGEATSILVGLAQRRANALAENQQQVEARAAHMRELNERLLAANAEGLHQRTHLNAAYAELQEAHDRLLKRSSHMSELNEQLRSANAECKIRREQLAEVNAKLHEALERLETRSSRMAELNELLRAANAECKARREELETLNAELAQANVRLSQLEDIRAQFTLIVTHELRAPVAAIQSYLKLILEGYVPETKVRETLEKAERRAMEQLALISDLLELSRIGSSAAQEHVQQVQIERLLSEQIDLLSADARVRGITIHTDIDKNLPPVLANPDQIKSLWNNLVSNAIKYNRDGGRVDISLHGEANRLNAVISDTGIGIPAEAMTRLFSEFFRADNAKAVSRMGTGLGLSIAKEIIERAGGRITAESVIDQGTTFRFWLPVSQPLVEAKGGEPLHASLRGEQSITATV